MAGELEYATASFSPLKAEQFPESNLAASVGHLYGSRHIIRDIWKTKWR
jgi:hypothetical protein